MNDLSIEQKSYPKERYDNLDGLRAISCIAIIVMHVRANSSFELPQGVAPVISSWTLFVYLFILISGFGMFCGYYEKFKVGGGES